MYLIGCQRFMESTPSVLIKKLGTSRYGVIRLRRRLPTVLPLWTQGFHRYELNFSDLKLVVQIKQHSEITFGDPRYVEVANRTVDMDSRVRLLCYPRGNFYPLSSVHTHGGSEDH